MLRICISSHDLTQCFLVDSDHTLSCQYEACSSPDYEIQFPSSLTTSHAGCSSWEVDEATDYSVLKYIIIKHRGSRHNILRGELVCTAYNIHLANEKLMRSGDNRDTKFTWDEKANHRVYISERVRKDGKISMDDN